MPCFYILVSKDDHELSHQAFLRSIGHERESLAPGVRGGLNEE